MTKEQVKGAPPTHLKILEADEIETLYGFPVFDDEDRVFYFALAPPEQIILSQLRGTKSRIYYILQLGYFKARQQFFTFDLQQVAADAHYVQRTYYPDFELTDLDINKTTRRKQRQFILEVLQYRYCGDEEQKQLYAKAQQVVRISSRPVYVFRELIAYLTRQRLVSPGYTVMQRMVGNVLQEEKARLTATAEAHLTSDHVTSLNDLLDNPNGLYEITKLKHEPKDFSNAEINQEIKRGEQIKSLYAVARDILPHLGISNESIKYYASLINYYSVFQMNQLEESPAHIYLLCFIYHRYQKLHDNLINCLIYRVRKLIDEARSIAKDRVYDYHQAHKNNLHKAGQVLKLFMDDTIAASTPFGDVQKKAFAIIRRQELAQVTNHILQTAQLDETQFGWEYLDQVAQRFKVGIRPILRAIDFEATSANKDLITAVHFLKTAFNKNKALTQYKGDNIPHAFISGTHKRYLYIPTDEGEKQLLVDRYEFLVYRLLRDNLEAGDVFCRDSVHFRSFEDDLLSDVQWQQKEALIARTGLPILNQKVEAHLADLKDALETQLEQVNQRIMAGENEHINIKKQGRWSLPYSSAGEQVNAPFFEVLPQFDIQAVIHFVNRYCPFLAEFTHVLHRNAGRHPDYHTLVACLLAWGTNMGLGRMGQISDVGYQKLVTTSNNFIRLETLQKANDTLSNAIAQLPIFQHHHIDDTVHSSSDGQKFETRIHTINARFSPKYFGLMML